MLFDQIFSLLNTAVLVGVFFVAYKRYLRPQIIGELQKKRADGEHNLLEQREFAQTLAEIAVKRNKREVDYRSLSEKVMLWKNSEAVLIEEQQQERARIQEKVEKREKEQYVRMVEMRVKARVVPQALAKARLELYDQYQTDEMGESYIKKVLEDLGNTAQRKEEWHGRRS